MSFSISSVPTSPGKAAMSTFCLMGDGCVELFCRAGLTRLHRIDARV